MIVLTILILNIGDEMEVNELYSKPLYLQISELIKKKIDEKYYKANQLLPSEMEIQKLYNVSRITARKAYKVLLDEGIIRTIKGKGTYVNDLQDKDWTWMNHFTSEVSASGRIPSSKILSFKVIKAEKELSELMNIEFGTPLFYIKRLRIIDNVPVWLTKTYIVCDIAEDLSKEYFSNKGVSQSVFYVLEKDFGVEFESGKKTEYIGEIRDKDLEYLITKDVSKYNKKGFLAKSRQGKYVIYEKTIFEPTISK